MVAKVKVGAFVLATLIPLLMVIRSTSYTSLQEVQGCTYHNRLCVLTEPTDIHEIVLDPAVVRLVPVVAKGAYGATEKTSSIARRTKALAALNGSIFGFGQSLWNPVLLKCAEFFGYTRDRALPLYAFKKEGEWLSLSPHVSGFFAWNDGGNNVIAGEIKTVWRIIFGEHEYAVYDLNKPLLTVIFTPAFGASTPHRKDVIDLVIRHDEIVACVAGGGAVIPRDGYVYRDCAVHLVGKVACGDSVKLLQECAIDGTLDTRIERMDTVIGGLPLLVHHGSLTASVQHGTTSFYKERNARTALGLLSDGTLLLVVVAQSALSDGMTIQELAAYMQQRGCVEALNLDGGDSSTMVVNHTVVNSSSGWQRLGISHERAVSNALCILPRIIKKG